MANLKNKLNQLADKTKQAAEQKAKTTTATTTKKSSGAGAAVSNITQAAQAAVQNKQQGSQGVTQASINRMEKAAQQNPNQTIADRQKAIRSGQKVTTTPAQTTSKITAGRESTTPLSKSAGSKGNTAAATWENGVAPPQKKEKQPIFTRNLNERRQGGMGKESTITMPIVKKADTLATENRFRELQTANNTGLQLNTLAGKINQNEQQLIDWGRRLSVLKAKANRGDESAVASYNLLADKYNAAFEDYVSDIDAYNKLYNGAYRDSAVRDNYARREYMQQRQANRDLGARRSYQQRLNEEEARAPQETTLRRKGASVGEHSYKRITGEEPREAGYTFTYEPTRLQQWGRAIHNSYVGNMKAAAGAFYRNSIPEGGSVSGMNSEIGVSDQSKARLQYWSNELLSSGREQSNLGTYQTSLATQGLGTFGTFIVDASIAGIQMLMDMGISVVTGGSMLPAMFVRSMGGGYLTAEQMGASSEEALAYGIGVGAVEALSEKMFSVFSIGNRFAKGAVNKEMSERIIDRLLKNMTLTPKGKTALNRLFTILFATGSEGLEEVAAGIMEPVIRKITMDPKLDISSEIDWQEALYEGLIGGLLGGIGGAVDLVNTKGTYWKYYKEGLTEGIDRYVATAKKYGIGSEEALQAAKDIWTAGNEKLNGVAGFIVGANADGTGGEWVPLIEATQETIDNGLPVTFHQVVAQDALNNYEYGVKDYGIVTSQDLNLRNYLTREENARKEAENRRLEAARREEAPTIDQAQPGQGGEFPGSTNGISPSSPQGELTETSRDSASDEGIVRLDTARSAQTRAQAPQGVAESLSGIPEEEMTQEEKDELQYGSGAVEDLGKYSGLAQRMGAPKTGRRTGLALRTPGVQQQAANLQQRVRGLSVVYKSMRRNRPGYVDRATGTIYLNSNLSKEKLLRSTLGHELLHFLKTGDPQLIDDIIAYMAQIGEDVQGEIARLRPLYEKEIREIYAADPAKMQQKLAELDEPGYFEEEVAANFIGRICEEQSETLDRLAAEKPGLLRRLVEALRRFLRELGATPEMQERIEVYEQAIARMNAALAKAGQNETTGAGGERFTFGGENAVNADLDALGQAVDMDAAGTEMRDIFRETGWFKGADGKWRFEIDDSKMKYRHQGDLNYLTDPEYREYLDLWDKVVTAFEPAEEEELERFRELDQRYKNVVPQAVYRLTKGGAVLSDIIEHEELFENYPQLRNAPIRFDNLPQGDKGNYNPITNELTLNRSLREAPEDTLVHEIQHALQSIEGFSEGASPEYWKRNAPAGEERSAYQLYRNTAGEIEARDVTARRKMSEEQRRNTMPDTGNEDTVFAERGSGDARELAPDELPAELIGNLDFGDDVRFNLRSMEEDKEDFRKDLAGIMDEAELGRDNRPFLPVKPNSDEHYKFAIDYSTLCRKRILIQAITERLQQELGRGLSPMESVRIRQELIKLRDAGAQIDVACALCYVEAARFNAMKYINDYLADPRAVMIDYLAKKNRTWIRNVLEPMQQRYWESLGKTGKYNKQKLNTEQKNKINEENKKLRATYEPESEREKALLQRLEEIDKNQFLSVDGLTKLASDEDTYPIYDAFITFLRDRGRAKAQESRSPYYKGDLMRATSGGKKLVTAAMIQALNEESGSRMQSWSDFEAMHMLDLMSSIMDLALNNAKAHCYTKVPDLVRVAGETGVMYNMSLIPAGDTGLNAEGKLDASCYDPHEGMPFDVMKDLRDEFPDTAGNICIGINDAQIRALMASPDIDFIIPYHESGLPKELKALLGLHDWRSYQSWQNEMPDTNKKGDRKKPSLKDWFSIEEARSFDGDGYEYMEHASRQYLKYCDEHGLVPVFPMFTGEDHLTPEPGYWKLLIDRKMVNQKTREIIEQKVVRPKFKKSTLLDVLNREIDSDVRKDQQMAIDTVVDRVMSGQTSLSQQMDQDLQSLGVLLKDAPMLNAVEKAGKEKGEDIRHRFLPEEEEGEEQTETAADETTPESKLQATIQKLTEQVARLTDRLDGKESAPEKAVAVAEKAEEETKEEDADIRYRLLDPDDEADSEVLDFLNSQPAERVYRAMQVINGKLYPPMAARVKGEDGKKRMAPASELGRWEQADERPELIKSGNKFELDKANGSGLQAAYNPYFHTSRSPLNDQFSSAYKRPNIVVVEGEIPSSELTSGYKAPHAKDPVGEMKWHSGPVSSKLKGNKARRVILSRWFKPVRIVPDAEVAGTIKNLLTDENIDIPYNVVTPSLRSALEKIGVPVRGGETESAAPAAEAKPKKSTQYNRTVVLEESTVDKYLADYASKSSPNYAQAYITMMSPDDFLALTTSRSRRWVIDETTKPLDTEELADVTRHQPFQLRINTETGEVIGHEGRHRMNALRSEGIENVPVLLFDSNNKYSKEAMDSLTLHGQDFGDTRSDASRTVEDVLPLSYANRDQIVERFATQPKTEEIYERYGRDTVRFSFVEGEEEPKNKYGIDNDVVKAIQSIGRKSVNRFTSAEINKTEKFARKFWEELGTKSPFFRAWFGDWRAYDTTPITIVPVKRGQQYKAGRTTIADTKRTDAGGQSNGTAISWGDTFKRETITHKPGSGISADIIGNIEALAQNAVLLDTYVSEPTGKSKMPGTAFMHSFYVLANDGTEISLFKLFAEEALSAKEEIFMRAYELKDIVKVTTLTNGVLPGTGGLTNVNIATINSVADLYDLVKTYDKQFTPAPDVDRAMLDDNGRPLVVYHGTDADFTVFDRTKGRSTMDIQGMFFSPWEIDAGGYGEKVGAYYLSIKNPAPEAVAYKALNRFKGQNDAGVKARDYLISLGYDGVNNNNEEYIAFYPEQIKSATDNIGTFDRSNPDVRYSFTEEEGAEAEAPKDLGSMEPSERSKELIATAAKAKQVKRQTEKILRSLRLTPKENALSNALLSRTLTVNELYRTSYDEPVDKSKVERAYEARKAYREAAAPVEEYNSQRRAALDKTAEAMVENSDDWKDRKSRFGYDRETARRNIMDIVKDEAEAKALIRTYIDPIREHEAEKNRMVARYNARIKALKLETRTRRGNQVSEAHAVQYVGELEFIRDWLEQLPEGETRGDVTYDEAMSLLNEFWTENPNLDKARIHAAVAEFRSIYDEIFAMINEARVLNGYAPIDYRKGYFPHFTSNSADSIIQSLANGLGLGVEVTELPTSIAGTTHLFRPGIQWSGHMLQRSGNDTDYNALEGWDRYIPAVANIIYHTEDIQNLRALERVLRSKYSDTTVRDEIERTRNDRNLTETQKNSILDELFKRDTTQLNYFVQWLREYTNQLAGKRADLDRVAEAEAGRKLYRIVQKFENRVAANMLGGNLSSAMTNFVPLFQAWGNVRTSSLLRAMWDTTVGAIKHDGFRDGSDFLVNRRGYEAMYQTLFDKTKDKLFIPFNIIDDFVSETIVRARYYDEMHNNPELPAEVALAEADIFAGSVLADRAVGELPVIFNSKNPFVKVFTMFQVEVNNDLSHFFKDIPRDAKKKGMAAVFFCILKYVLGVHIFNDLFEALFGRRISFDPLDMLNDLAADATGYKLPNGFELAADLIRTGEWKGWEAFESDKGDDFFGDLLGKDGDLISWLENLPFLGSLLGGGRYPILSALPEQAQFSSGLQAFADLIKKEGEQENADAYDLQKMYKAVRAPLAYFIPPAFGGQARKIAEGLYAASKGGSYTITTEGEKRLQYPIEGVADVIRASIFGKTATRGGKQWVRSDFDTLSVDQTEAYIDLVTAGSDSQKIYDILHDLKGEERDSIAKAYALASADLKDSERVRLLDALVSESQSEKFATMMTDGGLTFRQCAEVYDKYHELSKMGELKDSDDSYVYKKAYLATQFAAWIDGEGYTDEQKEVIEGQYKFWNMVPAEAGNYERFTAAGLSIDKALDLTDDWSQLKALPGSTYVSTAQKIGAVAAAGYLTEKERQNVVRSLMDDEKNADGVSQQTKFDQYIVGYQVPIECYSQYLTQSNGLKGDDLNGDGKTDSGSLVKKKLAVIDRLPLQPGQKTALALFATGNAESTIRKYAPWLR